MLSGFQWTPATTPLVAGIAGELRRRYVALIQRAYATLTAAQLAAYLGVDQAEALQSECFRSPCWRHYSATLAAALPAYAYADHQ